MSLEQSLKEQLNGYLALLEQNVTFKLSVADDENSLKVKEFVEEIAIMSDKLSIQEEKLEKTPSFELVAENGNSGVVFAGVPLGHEFASFVLALLQISGRAPKIEEEVVKTIQSISETLDFKTYVSLTCHNCPDVVQALNIMSVLNPNITHTMIDGGMFKEEVETLSIMAVPTVFLNGEEFSSGRQSLEEMVARVATVDSSQSLSEKDPYDVLVVGGGPAGAAAAIYAGRKGIRVGLVAERFGGQVLETLGIENIIGTPYTEGEKFMGQVEEHVRQYNVDIIKAQRAEKLEKRELVELTLANGVVLKSKTAILSTGASWRNLGISGEQEFKNKGVAYCPHCDGPLFAEKDVAVVGGGNSGIEAAIDLAGMAKHVTVLEFLPELKADEVLQKRLFSLPNVTVLTNVETTAITGDVKVNGLDYKERTTGEKHHIGLSGVFVLIGLVPNNQWLEGVVEMNNRGEIVVDKAGATSLEGVFAAGDCTDSVYKQIIISMGSGATAALGAFDYLIRE
ncbi:alkyl hydroperoxide reductase subunit F [Pilibacter termitis]|uniref:Alkyl hydroperoxide reductase subunit F n=1 Tax=Pilibacter termitis TaxID=263852 RepID=A0A1T4RGG3_9ENTE|nr:alkyl hydroperoxide reductase subunit F [Pilibacter termitis]SKA14818.1 alkyl hydroperoxide reductase subunit F [Pilibacter termitis]